MSALCLFKYKKKKLREFLHLAEFFISMSVVVSASYFFWALGEAFVVLSVLPWLWSLRAIGLICEDLSQLNLYSKTQYYILGFGGLVSLIILSFNISLPLTVAPISLCIGLIGLTFIIQSYTKSARNFGPLHHLNFGLMGFYFISRLSFATWIAEPELNTYGSMADIGLLIIFCTTLFPLYSETVFEKHEQILERALKARNEQLFSHSGFSEYKILSAGVTHEINNALTIINAKVEQMIRGKDHEPEKALRIILNSANRILKSVRTLREFIYPNDVSEDLELSEIMANVLTVYGQRLSNHGVSIEIIGLEGKFVQGMRVQLEQVFLGLINNSVEALDELSDKWIEISCKSKKDFAEIVYQDSTSGIYDEVADLLKNPNTTSVKVVDSAIRLMLAKDIVEKHKGQFNLMSESEYTTINISLPLMVSMSKLQSIQRVQELH